MKHAEIVQKLRGAIVQGRLQPGDRLPTRAQLQRQFGASPVTVQRALDVLADGGFTIASGRSGTHVTARPPHRHRIGLVFARTEKPAARPPLFHSALRAAAAGGGWSPMEIVPCYADDGRPDSPAFRALEADIADCRFAGLIALDGAAAPLEQVCRRHRRNLPRVHLSANPAHPWRIELDPRAWEAAAAARLQALGRTRAAILVSSEVDPSHPEWRGFLSTLKRRGVATADASILGLDKRRPAWVRHAVRLLWRQRPRPDAWLVLDDNLILDLIAAVETLREPVPAGLPIIAHCNFPLPGDLAAERRIPVCWLGYDMGEVLEACLGLLDRQRIARRPGAAAAGRVIRIPPRFAPPPRG